MIDTLIVNGTIVDGTGAPRFVGDIAISDGKIHAIGKLQHLSAKEVIDAKQMIVAPGYITQHAHYDAGLFWDPYCSDSGEHGVTTLLNANCGFSIAPVRKQDTERTMLMLSTTEQVPVAQQKIGVPWDWETFPQYLDKLRTLPKGVNVLTYLPINPLLVYVMGIEGAKSRRPTKVETEEIHRLINEAMDAGAIGISMSVMGFDGNSHLDYDGTCMPTDRLHEDDVIEIARAVATRGEGIIQVLSQIGPNGNRPLTEKVARMAKGSGARVLHNVLLTAEGVPEMVEGDIAWLESIREEACDLVAGALMTPGWVEWGIRDLDTAAGQMAAVREIMACVDEDAAIHGLISSPEFVKRFSDEYDQNGASNGAGGFEGQIIVSLGDVPELDRYLNRTLLDIASELETSVIGALCDLAHRSDLKLQMKSPPFAATDGSQAVRLMRQPGIAIGVSDAGAHTKAFSSGWYGTDILSRIVRDQKLMSLEEAHYQLSLKVARFLHMEDRGALLPGFAADLVMYELSDLYIEKDRYDIVHDMPGGDWRRKAKAGGYARIMVNGETTHINDTSNGKTPGKLLRITQSQSPVGIAAE